MFSLLETALSGSDEVDGLCIWHRFAKLRLSKLTLSSFSMAAGRVLKEPSHDVRLIAA